jgi:hypothetical protein
VLDHPVNCFDRSYFMSVLLLIIIENVNAARDNFWIIVINWFPGWRFDVKNYLIDTK